MSVIVLAEHSEGAFKKKSLEAVQYAAGIARSIGTTATAIVLGTVGEDQMKDLGKYGAQKVLHVSDARLDQFSARAAAEAVITAAQKEAAKVIVASHDVMGRMVAPRIAARLNAGLVAGAVGMPDLSKG